MSNYSSSWNISFDTYDNKIYWALLNANGVLALIVGGFGIYITWFWTPKVFGHYRYFLFNISLWAFLFDIFTTFFYSPWILYPAIICCPTGLLKTSSIFWANILFGFLIFFHGGTNIAVFSAFLYRLIILKGKLQTILRPKFVICLITLHLFYELPSEILFHLCSWDSSAIKESILKRFPNVAKYYPNENMACAAMSLDVGFPYNYLYLGVILLSFFVTTPFIVVMVYQTKTLLEKQKDMMTTKTYMMHKELLRTLIFQLVIPGVTLLIPHLLTAIFLIIRIENIAVLFQANFIVGTLHSTMNTVMMVYFIKPYRNQFIHNFWDNSKLCLLKYCWKFRDSNQSIHDINNSNQLNPTLTTSSIIPQLSVRPTKATSS